MIYMNIFLLVMGSFMIVNVLMFFFFISLSRGNLIFLREIFLVEYFLYKMLMDFKFLLIEGLFIYNVCKDCVMVDFVEEIVMV